MFEIGVALSGNPKWREQMDSNDVKIAAGEEMVQLFKKWCCEAKQAVLCWIWLARKEGVAKTLGR